jgi:tetratricopeptide (TPR) repeat protein
LGCICTLLLLKTAGFLSQEHISSRHKTLVSMLGPVRLTQGRLNGQADYAPYPTPVNPRSSAWDHFKKQALQRADVSIPGSMLDLAFVDLASRGVDAAIAEIEGSLEEEAGEATLFSDLSALYDERARTRNRPVDYVSALDLAEQAIALAPDLPEARFNEATALENLSLFYEARSAWRQYLEIDSSSQWSNEARKHLESLSRIVRSQHRVDPYQLLLQEITTGNEGAVSGVAKANPQEAREVLEKNLIPRWAEAVARGEKEKAERRFSETRRIADILADRGGDRIFQKIVAEMQAAIRAPYSLKTRIFIQALRQYRSGLERLDDEGANDTAILEFASSRQKLSSIQSAATLAPQLQQAWCQIRQGNFPEARRTLEELREDPHAALYPSLEARRQILIGFIEQGEDPSKALKAHENALSIFRAIGERGNVADEQNAIAMILDSLGRPEDGWLRRYSALSWASQTSLGERQLDIVFYIFQEATLASLDQRRPRAALVFQSRSLLLAKALQSHAKIVRASLRRARIEAALGQRGPAKQDFARAIRDLQLANQVGAREALAPLIDITRREIDESEDRAAAIAQELQLSGRLGARADFDFRSGNTASAKSDLARAIDGLERQRSRVTSSNDRVSFLDQAQPLYERMAALQLHLAKPEDALETLERFRSRVLLEQMKEASGSGRANIDKSTAVPLGWREMCRRVPEHTDIIFFASVEGRLMSWLLRPSGILVATQQPPWGPVSLWAKSLRTGPESFPKNFGKDLEMLYRELIQPWSKDLQAGDRLIFIPTQSLYRVPFAALRNPITGRFLVQDYAIGVAPSISGFFAAVAQDQKLSRRPLSTALLVGNPTIDNRLQKSLAGSLPGADREINLLSALYTGVETWALTKKKATPDRVLAFLEKSDIAHFAVHALETPRDPGNSRLLLSSDEGKPGDLLARDILRRRLPRTRLVMLASCSTQVGPVSPSEGSLSLAYSFLAAGVPAVVGSLWPVDDASTTRLSVRFHQELRHGADAISALRTAQLEEIDVPQRNLNWTWASFQVFGGAATRSPDSAQAR